MSRPGSRHGGSVEKAREEQLRAELAEVRKVNEAIEGVLASLEHAKSNTKTVDRTVSASTSLLQMWTSILSQTEHNQRLILDPEWHGTSQDIADIETEDQEKELAVERQLAEEQERKAAAALKVEEDEQKRAEATLRASKTASAVRGRVRGGARGASVVPQTPGTSSNTSMIGSIRGSYSTRRTTSGLSRGATRGTRAKS